MPADPRIAAVEPGASAPGLDVQNYLNVLSVIDRTILPRRLLFYNGTATLILLAMRQQAFPVNARSASSGASLEGLASAIADLCRAGTPVVHRSEPLPGAAPSGPGFSAIAILNAGAGPARDRQYRFAQSGWPVATPPDAGFASVAAAARIAWSMAAWRGSHAGERDSPTLILAISETLAEDLSISVEGGVTITSTPPALLGRLVASWRSGEGTAPLRVGEGGDAGTGQDGAKE